MKNKKTGVKAKKAEPTPPPISESAGQVQPEQVQPEPDRSENQTTASADIPIHETLFSISSEPFPETDAQSAQPPQDGTIDDAHQEIAEKISELTPGEAEIAASELADTEAAQSAESGQDDDHKSSDKIKKGKDHLEQINASKPEKPRKQIDYSTGMAYYLRIAGTLAAVCAFVAIMLAVINGVTADKIAQNEKKAAYEAIGALFNGYDQLRKLDGTFSSPVTGVTAVDRGGAAIGYCVFVSPRGFANSINLAVGVDLTGKATGVKIIGMNETPGVGSKTGEEDFLSQFIGKTADITLDGSIDAVAGATISSKAVYSGVKAALEAIAALPNEAQTTAETAAETTLESAAETTAETAAESAAAETTAAESAAADTSVQTETTADGGAAAETAVEGGGV